METLSVGMYVRTLNGIVKIDKIQDNVMKDTKGYLHYGDFVKASYNIIDLIKPKDIILGKDGRLYQCWKIYKDYVFTYSKNKQGETITLVDYQIDKILTKEQMKQMAYKVGE